MSVLDLQSDADMEDDFSFLQPLDFITKDAYQLQKIVKEKKNTMNNESRQEREGEVEVERKEEVQGDKAEKDREQEIGKEKEESKQDHIQMEKLEPEENGAGGGDLR